MQTLSVHLAVQNLEWHILFVSITAAPYGSHSLHIACPKRIQRKNNMKYYAQVTIMRACLCLVNSNLNPIMTTYYFHIKRAAVDPPQVLQCRLFPWVDNYSDDKGGWERTLAAQGFICLLQYLCIVILQDAAVLIDANRQHALFHHEILLFCRVFEMQRK